MKKMHCILCVIVVFCSASMLSCQKSDQLNITEKIDHYPSIFPDYNQIVIPPNIAPLNFNIEEAGDAYDVKIQGKCGVPILIHSKSSVVDIPMNKWRKLLTENRGENIWIDVAVKNNTTGWSQFKPMEIRVANDDMDNHLAYRLINVGYILWKKMGLYQRDLTSFKETPIMVNRSSEGNCMNCHSFSMNRPDYFSFHMRGKHNGTLISTPDSIFKVETKTEYTLASAAYPAWHPDGKHIAFSVNVVRQFFHSVDKQNEVYDKASDLIIYNIETNTVTTHPSVSTLDREVLPNWSPDGKYLYFCRASRFSDTLNYNEVYYDLMRITYNTQTNEWGKLDTILLASIDKKTISFPKISPDGKFIMYTGASHGYFTIYNFSSDLFLLNTETKEVEPYPFNSETTDSYHSWSSNGRWIVFSSKRLDGITTRPFITYFDENGVAHKPFVIPQKDPLFYHSFNINFNIPEFLTGAVKVHKQKQIKAVWGEAIAAQFDQSVDVDALSGASNIPRESSLH